MHRSVPLPSLTCSATGSRRGTLSGWGCVLCKGAQPGFNGKGGTFEFPVDKVKFYDPFI